MTCSPPSFFCNGQLRISRTLRTPSNNWSMLRCVQHTWKSCFLFPHQPMIAEGWRIRWTDCYINSQRLKQRLNSSSMLKLWLKPFWQLLVPGIFWEQTLHHCHCGWIRLALAIKVLQSPARNWLPWEQLCNLRHQDLVFPISFHNVSERITTFCEEKSRKPHPSESPFLTYSLYALYFQFMSVFSFDGNALLSLAPKSVF